MWVNFPYFTFTKRKQCYLKIHTFTSATPSVPNFSFRGQYKLLKPIQRPFLIGQKKGRQFYLLTFA